MLLFNAYYGGNSATVIEAVAVILAARIAGSGEFVLAFEGTELW